MASNTAMIVPLDMGDVSIEQVGGKGSALAELAAAGLPVPSGFLIATSAYDVFVEANDLTGDILAAATGVDLADPLTAEAASKKIRGLFEAAQMPEELVRVVQAAYQDLGGRHVAVRSSATAEDLPELSFAGQQDSYLNVSGEQALLTAVQRCWASLWTARAIVYRARMGIDHGVVSMGVVVLTMVNADVSGILFTANPSTGDRSELVVNASFGLGEAVVGGQVTPDTVVVDHDSLTIKDVVIGSKKEMIVAADQGVETRDVPVARREKPALADERIRELAELGLKAQAVRGGDPQDIEWALVDDGCVLLQSRPITGLPDPEPVLSWDAPYEGAQLIRRQVVENMPEPLSPLFEDLYLNEGLDKGMDALMAAMEIPFDLGDFIQRPIFLSVNGYGYLRYEFSSSWRMLGLIPRVLVWYVRKLPALLRSLVPLWRDGGLAEYQDTIARWRNVAANDASSHALIAGIRELAYADAKYWFYITMMVGAAKVTDGLFDWFLSSRRLEGDLISGVFLRGFPSKTLEAEADLVRIAEEISRHSELREVVSGAPLEALIDTLRRSDGGRIVVDRIDAHLEQYGHLVYNLDFAAPTQGEDPVPVLMALRAFVQDSTSLEDLSSREARLVAERESLERETAASLGRVRRWIFRKILSWAQRFGPYREEALFYMGAGWPVLRRMALTLGDRLVAADILKNPDDVFYLRYPELEAVFPTPAPHKVDEDVSHVDFGAEAAARRELREVRRRIHPPGRVPVDASFKFGPFDLTRFIETWETQKRNAEDATELNGFAVSPGTVTGVASVIVSPEGFPDMAKDTILVCPTTTPAWTPLFGQAKGLVTDIGGVLAHGSIVAREYGIPAVLGTGNATERIVNGQRIEVDGSRGTVRILE